MENQQTWGVGVEKQSWFKTALKNKKPNSCRSWGRSWSPNQIRVCWHNLSFIGAVKEMYREGDGVWVVEGKRPDFFLILSETKKLHKFKKRALSRTIFFRKTKETSTRSAHTTNNFSEAFWGLCEDSTHCIDSKHERSEQIRNRIRSLAGILFKPFTSRTSDCRGHGGGCPFDSPAFQVMGRTPFISQTSDFLFPLQPPTPPYPDKPPRPSHPEKLDFGPFRLRLAPFRLRFGSVLAPFRVCFGSVSGLFRGVGWGRGGVGERGFCKGKEYL